MSKETEFIANAQKLIKNACADSLAKLERGDTIVIDDAFKYDYGDGHVYLAGDEFVVKTVERDEAAGLTRLGVTVVKADSEGCYPIRAKVGWDAEFNNHIPLFKYLRRTDDDGMVRQKLRELCRDYLSETDDKPTKHPHLPPNDIVLM